MLKRAQFAALFTVSVPLLFVFWLVFVGTFDEWELLVGMGAAVAGGLAICIVENAEHSHFLPHFENVMQIVFAPRLVLQGTYKIILVALRDLLGGGKSASIFFVAPFKTDAVRNPHDTARRVLATAYTTMTPTSIVLGINTRERIMLFHQIDRSGLPEMTKNLGARA